MMIQFFYRKKSFNVENVNPKRIGGGKVEHNC